MNILEYYIFSNISEPKHYLTPSSLLFYFSIFNFLINSGKSFSSFGKSGKTSMASVYKYYFVGKYLFVMAFTIS